MLTQSLGLLALAMLLPDRKQTANTKLASKQAYLSSVIPQTLEEAVDWAPKHNLEDVLAKVTSDPMGQERIDR